MAVDLSALEAGTLRAASLSGLILVNPTSNRGIQPQLVGAPKFLFNYEGENTVSLESDITDHFVENNTAIQDQIALKPEMITTNGYIGELNDVVPELVQTLKTAADKLVLLAALSPTISATANIAYVKALNAFNVASAVARVGVSVWNSVVNGQSKQGAAYSQFYGYYKNRQLFTVQTPWAVFEDMAIKSIRATQDEETRMISTFEITFKKMRFAQTITSKGSSLQFQGRLQSQGSSLIDQGVSTPSPAGSFSGALTQSFGVL